LTAVALVIDSYVYVEDASIHAPVQPGGSSTQAEPFWAESAIAVTSAVLILLWRRRKFVEVGQRSGGLRDRRLFVAVDAGDGGRRGRWR